MTNKAEIAKWFKADQIFFYLYVNTNKKEKQMKFIRSAGAQFIMWIIVTLLPTNIKVFIHW